MENLSNKTIQELRSIAKEKGIELEPTMKKDDIIKAIEEKLIEEEFDDIGFTPKKEVSNKNKKQDKFSIIRRVKVLPRNPDEVRDSVTVTIINAFGSRTFLVPFNIEINLPEPVIKKLENTYYQKFIKTKVKGIGIVDKPIRDKAYSIEYIDKK